MNTKKAYIKSDGEIGEKEIPAIEYVDENHPAAAAFPADLFETTGTGNIYYHLDFARN